MIYVESQVPPRAKTQLAKYPESGTFDRRDVYIITQNALADRTYMQCVRDHYGVNRPDLNHPDSLKTRSVWQRALFDFSWQHLGREETYPREPIWVPDETNFEMAFQQYLDELRTRPRLPGEDVKIENGRVSGGREAARRPSARRAWRRLDRGRLPGVKSQGARAL